MESDESLSYGYEARETGLEMEFPDDGWAGWLKLKYFIPAMKKQLCLSIILIMAVCSLAVAQTIDSSGVWKIVPDTAAAVSPVAGSVSSGTNSDTLRSSAPDTAAASGEKKPEASNLKLIKRSYNSRQQLLLASGMMIFVIAMMTAAQQWNPE